MNKMEAHILCINREKLEECGISNGYYADEDGKIATQVLSEYTFKTRGPLESDDNYVQPIPYIVFVDKQTGKILSYKRHNDAERNNESRLYGRRSIGIGGHIEKHELEATETDPILATAIREIQEELCITISKQDLTYKGLIFINTPSSVEYYHLGVVYKVDIEEGNTNQEGEFHTQFMSPSELLQAGSQGTIELELRSQYLLISLFKPGKHKREHIHKNEQ